MKELPVRRLTLYLSKPNQPGFLADRFIAPRPARRQLRDTAKAAQRLLETAYRLHDGSGYLPHSVQRYIRTLITRAQWVYLALNGATRHDVLYDLHLVAPPPSLLRHTRARRLHRAATAAVPEDAPEDDPPAGAMPDPSTP